MGVVLQLVQHRDSDRAQTSLAENVTKMAETIATLKGTVQSYGPKLDYIIKHPQSDEQKAAAQKLQKDLLGARRVSFSATEELRMLPPDAGGNWTLHLGNVADMQLQGSDSLDRAQFFFDGVPMSLPPSSPSSGFTSDGTLLMEGKMKTYTFDTGENKRQEITVAGRTFVITFLRSRALPLPYPNPFEYTFGVVER